MNDSIIIIIIIQLKVNGGFVEKVNFILCQFSSKVL